MKNICIYILCLFVLSGCFGIWWDSSSGVGLSLQDREGFSILVPWSWLEVKGEDLPKPKTGEIVLAHAWENQRQWYFNNIVVLQVEKSKDLDSSSLMQSSINSLRSQIEGFTILKENTVTFADNAPGLFLTYTGRYNANTPESFYIQTARSCESGDYYITISVWEVLDDYKRYEDILQTFRCN